MARFFPRFPFHSILHVFFSGLTFFPESFFMSWLCFFRYWLLLLLLLVLLLLPLPLFFIFILFSCILASFAIFSSDKSGCIHESIFCHSDTKNISVEQIFDEQTHGFLCELCAFLISFFFFVFSCRLCCCVWIWIWIWIYKSR